MNEDVKNIIDQLTEKLSLQNKTTEELKAIAESYPYFSFPKFLLAKKFSEQDDSSTTQQLQQTALYFSNPFWLNYLLSKNGFTFLKVESNEVASENVKKDIEESIVSNYEPNSFEEQLVTTEESISVERTQSREPYNVDEEIEISNDSDESLTTNVSTEEIISETERLGEEIQTAHVNAMPDTEEIKSSSDSDESLTTNISEEEAIPETEHLGEEIEIADVNAMPGAEGEIEVSNDSNESLTTNVPGEEIIPDTEYLGEETQIAEVSPASSDISNEIAKAENESFENSIGESNQLQNEETESEEMVDKEHEKLSKLIAQHLSEFKKPLEDSEDIPLETRVYHAIDYFASQGIKLDPRLITQDMLGSKVKKFTDWLKQMKRANQNPTDLGTDIETEHLIEKIAQSSNETKEVITETMANVLAKQGKTEKAIQLYQKLSFLNPTKYAYFAAKINELKGLQ